MRMGIKVGRIERGAWMRVLPVTLLLSACSGGGDAGDGGGPGPGLTPILQVGMQRQYTGTTTRAVVYANPSASTPNNTLAYSFVENQSVVQPQGSVGADFDVHIDYAYTITQDPGVGTVPISQNVDNYENLLISGESQQLSSVAQNTTVMSNDETSNALGGGPYTETTTTNAMFPSPRNSFSYPLQTGATMTVPQSSTETISFSDVNASNGAPPNGSNVGYSRSRNENDDGSFSYQSTEVNGDTLNATENADGTGTYVFTSATATTTTTLGAPYLASGTHELPVTRSVLNAATATTTTTSYTAADWYPTAGDPNVPLVLQSENVVGPVPTLPAECDGAVLRTDIYEVDITTTSQNTLSPSYSVTKTRSFNANGVVVCQLTQEASYAYDILTGDLVSTTTTDTQALLSAINY